MPTLLLGIDARKARAGAKVYESSSKKVVDSTNKMKKSQKATTAGMQSLGQSFTALKGKLAALAAGYVALKVAQDAVSTFMSFESQMAQLQTVVRGTADDMMFLSDAAREAGVSTKFSASEAAAGLTFLARAGFETSEAIAALPGTLALATAGNLELARAADIASNVLSQFNIEASETARIGDILVTTANSANTNIEQLAEGMKFAGTLAGTLGISVEEAAAALGVMGNMGIQASLAGTNLRGIFARLIDPMNEGKTVLEDMGIALKDINPETNTLAEIFGRLSDAGMTTNEALALFGRLNVTAAMAVKNQAGKLKELTKANEESAGAAQEAADIIGDTLEGKIKSLGSATEELYIQLVGGTGLASGLKDITDASTDLLRIMSGNEEAMANASDSAAFWAGTLKILKGSLELIGTVWTNLINHLGDGVDLILDWFGVDIHNKIGTFLKDFGRMEHSSIVFKASMVATFEQISAGFQIFLIKPMQEAIKEMTFAFRDASKFMGLVFKAPLAAIVTSIAKFGEDILNTVGLIIGGLSKLAAYIPGVGSDVAAGLNNASASTKAFAKEIMKSAIDLTGDVGKEMEKTLDSMGTHMNKAVIAGVSGVTHFKEKMTELDEAKQTSIDKMNKSVITQVEAEIQIQSEKTEKLKAMEKEAEEEKDEERKKTIEKEVAAAKEVERRKNKIATDAAADRIEQARVEANMRIAAYGSILGSLASMTSMMAETSKEAFYIHKGLAFAQASVNAFLAYTNVMASNFAMTNPVLAQAMAGTAFAATMSQASMIASQEYKGGRALGGGVPSDSLVRVGENGPELITSGGKQMLATGGDNALVTPLGGIGGTTVNVTLVGAKGNENVSQQTNSDGSVDVKILMNAVRSEMINDVSSNGPFSRTMTSQFGLNRSAGLRR